MRIVCPFQKDPFANTYILGEEGMPAIVIDPGNNENGCLARYLARHHDGKVAAILLTHGHYDHIHGLSTLEVEAPVYVHPLDEPFLKDDRYNLYPGLSIDWKDVRAVEDGETIPTPYGPLRVIHTPFHTPGSVCFLDEEGHLFSGDTLFRRSIGRSDLPGGNSRLLKASLAKLFSLPDHIKVYPGHEGMTTIGEEKRYNPYYSSLFLK